MSEDKPAAPQGLEEKLRSWRPDDGRPARRRISTLRRSRRFRVEPDEDGLPVVSHAPMDVRSFWRRADSSKEKDPLYEYAREERDEPPKGEQWK